MKKYYLFILMIICLSQTLFAQLNAELWNPVLGRDYQTITSPKVDAETPNNINNQLTFYFWAGSTSSYQLDLALQSWLSTKNNVSLQRIPLVKRPKWRLLAKAWLVVEQLPDAEQILSNIYKAIHVDQIDILSFDDLLPLIDSQSLDELEFKTNFYSLAINQQLNALQKSAQLFPIRTVPTIIINNRWSIDASNQLTADQFIAIIEKLTSKPLPSA